MLIGLSAFAPGASAQQYCLSGVVNKASGPNLKVGDPFLLTVSVLPRSESCMGDGNSSGYCLADVRLQAESGRKKWAPLGAIPKNLAISTERRPFDKDRPYLSVVNISGPLLRISSDSEPAPPGSLSVVFELRNFPGDLLPSGKLPSAIPVPTPAQMIPGSNLSFQVIDGAAPDEVTLMGNACAVPKCIIPTGETTEFHHWGHTIPDTTWWDPSIAAFRQTAQPATMSFVGRRVRERSPITGKDACFDSFPSAVKIAGKRLPFTKVTGSAWTIESGNVWEYDHIGRIMSVISDYQDALRERVRKGGAASCETVLYQQMEMQCEDGSDTWVPYGGLNTLRIVISTDKLDVYRADKHASCRTSTAGCEPIP